MDPDGGGRLTAAGARLQKVMAVGTPTAGSETDGATTGVSDPYQDAGPTTGSSATEPVGQPVTGVPSQADAPRFDPVPTGIISRRTRRRLIGVAAGAGAIALVVVLVTGFVVGSGSQAALAAVVRSVNSSTADKTADLHLSMNEFVAGRQTVTANGDGSVDFTDHAAQLSMNLTGAPGIAGEQLSEIALDGTLYLSLPQVSRLLPGKQWVAAGVGGTPATPGATSNPTDLLQVLASKGNTVTSLGTTSIDGVTVNAYKVVLNPSYIRSHPDSSSLGPAERQAVSSMLDSMGLEMNVYIDSATGLFRRVVETLHLATGGLSISATSTDDFTDYGTPVTITAPPAGQVATLPQFEQAAGETASSGYGTASAGFGSASST